MLCALIVRFFIVCFVLLLLALFGFSLRQVCYLLVMIVLCLLMFGNLVVIWWAWCFTCLFGCDLLVSGCYVNSVALIVLLWYCILLFVWFRLCFLVCYCVFLLVFVFDVAVCYYGCLCYCWV